ncbi:hypothetical protein NP233_g9812 [Leucocoprinus birnbaumii]|uniref:Uncharacterized protein n=1 Tax=Leucocoprinus birnbaumii TaxID=56174 RepID=A0AAD5VNA5_9AGAR|nr:hypothetical protein NP233_g9812 [Leucocoprinus birnbaumii]
MLVGIVSTDRLFLSPIGNYNKKYGPLSAAKFQFTLSCPRNDSVLREDWMTGLEVLRKIQGSIAATTKRRYLILEDTIPPSIRLSAPIFEKKGTPRMTFHVSQNSDTEDINDNDYATSLWPVPSEHQESLEAISNTHRVLPLAIYDEENECINIEDAEDRLTDTLVEVAFSLQHYTMSKDTAAAHDSFTGKIEQIVVIRPPGPPLASPFKDFGRRGPWRPIEAQPFTVPSGAGVSPSALAMLTLCDGKTKTTATKKTANRTSAPTVTPPKAPHSYMKRQPISAVTTPPLVSASASAAVAGPSRIPARRARRATRSGTSKASIQTPILVVDTNIDAHKDAPESPMLVSDSTSERSQNSAEPETTSKSKTKAPANLNKRRLNGQSKAVEEVMEEVEDFDGDVSETETLDGKPEVESSPPAEVAPVVEEPPKKRARTTKGKARAL